MSISTQHSDEHEWRMGADMLRAWCVKCGRRAPVQIEDLLMDWRSALVRGGLCDAPAPALIQHA